MKQVCDALGVARSNVSVRRTRAVDWQDGRSAERGNDTALVAEIQQPLKDLPSYGYRRAWGLMRGERERSQAVPVNHKRVYRVMRAHGLLLQRKRKRPTIILRHDGRVAVEKSDQRWCSDGFEFRCENGEPVRVAFASTVGGTNVYGTHITQIAFWAMMFLIRLKKSIPFIARIV